VPADAAIQDAKKGAKGGKKRHKQHPQWVTPVADYDDGNDDKVDCSDMGYVSTAVCSGKQVRLPRETS
jgi:hypothetical protein